MEGYLQYRASCFCMEKTTHGFQSFLFAISCNFVKEKNSFYIIYHMV